MIADIFKIFNRYFLRYGPNTVVTMISLHSSFQKLVGPTNFENGHIILFVSISAAIGYICTWPMLLFHAFVRGASDKFVLNCAIVRDKNRKMVKIEDKFVEFESARDSVDSFRHLREHGNSMHCAGATWIQLTSLQFLADCNYIIPFGFYSILAAFFVVIVGTLVWLKALSLEKTWLVIFSKAE